MRIGLRHGLGSHLTKVRRAIALRVGSVMGGVCLLGLWLGPSLVQAQLPVARLDHVFPPGVQLGATNGVLTLTGENLEEAKTLITRVGGWESFPVPSAGGEDTGERAVFRVSVPGLTSPGVYDVRVAGRYGVSNPRRLVVGTEVQKLDQGTETEPAKAIPLARGEAVLGRIEAGASDYFRLELKQGEQVDLECQAAQLDSRLDPVLKVTDAEQREVARSRSLGEVHFVAAKDGSYVVRLHDFLNGGGDAYLYRLAFTQGPKVEGVIPAVVRLGMTNVVQLVGRGLPGGKPWTQVWNLSNAKALGRSWVEASVSDGGLQLTQHHRSIHWSRPASSWLDQWIWNTASLGKDWPDQSLALGVTKDAVLLEKEPNSVRAQAQTISVPCDLTGAFYPRGDQDWYTFEARKGEVWVVEVISQRLGRGADPYLYMHRVGKTDKGKEKVEDEADAYDLDLGGGQDFPLSSGDAQIRYEVKADGWLRLMVRDQAQGVADDPLRIYRLVVRRERPDFRLSVVPAIPPSANKDARDVKVWSSSVRRGGVIPMRVWVWRREGMDAPIEIDVRGLPAGVKCVGGVVPAGQNSALVTLEVATNAVAWAGGVSVVGKARQGDLELVREASAGTVTWPVGDFNLEKVQSRAVDEWAVGIVDRDLAPFRVGTVPEGVIQACPGMKVSIPVQWQSAKEVQGKAKLRLLGHVALGAGRELEVEGKPSGQSQVELDLAQTVIPVGDHWLYWQGQVVVKYVKDEALVQKLEEEKKSGDEKKKKEAEERLKRAAARDLTDYFYSPAVKLQVLAAPLQLDLGTNQIVMTTNAPASIAVQCRRLFGFGDTIEITGAFPEKTTALQVDKVTVPKDKGEITMVVKPGVELKAGEYPLVVKAAVKWNGQDLAMTRRVMVRVP